tara:strand:- start:197 stop:463 length:267 start_codon:yes stop_codon:yes gene_type:complete
LIDLLIVRISTKINIQYEIKIKKINIIYIFLKNKLKKIKDEVRKTELKNHFILIIDFVGSSSRKVFNNTPPLRKAKANSIPNLDIDGN